METGFKIKDTNLSKGIAMCLMIIHHLFWNVNNMGVNIYWQDLVQKIGILGKVCVPIFLILSGYGLGISTNAGFNVKNFYKKHLTKLYFNYWITITISFLVGIIFFRGKAYDLLGNTAILKIIINYTGLQYLNGYMGYNSSWWFITAIVMLYLLFPLIHVMIKKTNVIFILFSFILLFPSALSFEFYNLKWVTFNFFPFIVGVFLAEVNFFESIEKLNAPRAKLYILFMIIGLYAFFIPTRLRYGMTFEGYALDNLFAILIIIFNFLYLNKIKYLNSFFILIGKYSMDMFLIHGFVVTLYTAEITYSLKNPIIMFIFVLIVSLFISILLYNFKKEFFGKLLLIKENLLKRYKE